MELLIELVRENRVLYDTSHEDYMRTKLKDEIWQKIAKELNYANGQAVKDVWKKLRDCHRDALRRQKKEKSGDVAAKIKIWTYQKQMDFLVQYMTNRATTGNMDDSQEDVELDAVDDHEMEDTPTQEGDEDQVQEQQVNEEVQPIPSISRKRKTDITTLLKENLENYGQRCKLRDQERKRILEKKNNEECEKNDDSLYQFFLSMYNTTKNLPKTPQLKIKRVLFDAVQWEEEMVPSPRVSSYPYNAAQSPQDISRPCTSMSGSNILGLTPYNAASSPQDISRPCTSMSGSNISGLIPYNSTPSPQDIEGCSGLKSYLQNFNE